MRRLPYLPLLLSLTTSCGDGGTGPVRRTGLRVVSGGTPVADTIDALVVAPLVFELRDADGKPVVGGSVTVEGVTPPGGNAVTGVTLVPVLSTGRDCRDAEFGPFRFASGVTDAAGQVRFCVRRGSIAGPTTLTARSFETQDSTTVSYSILPGRATGFRVSPDTAVVVGAEALLPGGIVDRRGNVRTDAVTAQTSGGIVTVVAGPRPAVRGLVFGSQWVQLTAGGFRDSTQVSVMPTGRVLTWNADTKTVELRNLDGGGARAVTPSSLNTAAVPRFDVARQRAYFISDANASLNNRVVVVDTTGANARVIDKSGTIDRIQALRPMADGSLLVLATPAPTSPFFGSSELRVWRIAPDSTITEVARVPNSTFAAYTADISPDGSKLAYIKTGLFGGREELTVLTLATGVVTKVTENAYAPRWSAAGDRIAYLSIASAMFFPATSGELYVIRTDGSLPSNYSGTRRFNPGLTFSPDGTYVMGRRVEGGWQVYSVSDAASSATAPLRSATGESRLLQPDWR